MQAEIWRLLGNKGDRVPFNCIDGVNIAVGDAGGASWVKKYE